MRTGNAIVSIFFFWLAFRAPLEIYNIGKDFIGCPDCGIAGISYSSWIVFAIFIPLIFGFLSLISGMEPVHIKTKIDKKHDRVKDKDVIDEVEPEIAEFSIEKERDSFISELGEHIKNIKSDKLK